MIGELEGEFIVGGLEMRVFLRPLTAGAQPRNTTKSQQATKLTKRCIG